MVLCILSKNRLQIAPFYTYHIMISFQAQTSLKQAQPSYHIVPFHLKGSKHEQAQVTNYFANSISESPLIKSKVSLEPNMQKKYASIQGYQLEGKSYEQMHDLYECRLSRSTEDLSKVQIYLYHQIKRITEWKLDSKYEQGNGHLGMMLRYCELQEALHQ